MTGQRGSRRGRGAIGVAAVVVVVGALALGGIAALADERARRPVLHQDVVPPRGEARAGDFGPGVLGPEPGARQNPSAFASGSKLLPAPTAAARQRDGEPVHGRGGFAADRDTEAVPDYQTGPDDTLRYVTVFNPSVIPFKRMSALNAVDDDYTLRIEPGALTDLPIGGVRARDRDLFWGDLVVELRPGDDVPIPSVAPDMRILSYEIQPDIAVVFSRDAADNFYVRSDETDAAGTYRLVFLADAGAGYFAPKVPRGYRVNDIPPEVRRDLLPELPQRVQRSADRALRFVGVGPSSDLGEALDKLVYYFRDFEAKAAPEASGDIFWDLFVSQAGVCRHRAFAFMIAANALGVPTRYVTNEAHAFVEVWVPEAGWIRIDLGGAALRMEVENAADKSIHRPREEDAFSKPPSYSENYTRLEGDIRGLSSRQLDEAKSPVRDPDADFDLGDDGSGDGLGLDPGADQPIGPGRSLPAMPPSALAGKQPTEVLVTDADPVGFRGESMRVRGRFATADGRPLAGQRVDIYLAPAGYEGDDAVVIGHTVTDDDGRYDADVDLPAHLELRDYQVYAAAPGDRTYAPAVSE